MRIVIAAFTLCAGCPESVATTFVTVPAGFATVGVPVICPELLSARPAGIEEPLATVQVSAPVPPVAVKAPV